MWLPPVRCKAIFFYDHSSGHGAYAAEALLANHANKGPDWKGSVPVMRDGWFNDAGAKRAQVMQFKEGDLLTRAITHPPGLDPHATLSEQQATPGVASDTATVPPPPPTAEETQAAFKLFYAGTKTTLKKHNPTADAAALLALGWSKWGTLTTEKHMGFVVKHRQKSTVGTAQAAGERVLSAGSPVPRLLWGRNKGLEILLAERGLYPAAGLKGSCLTSKDHSDASDCCCAKLLSVQPDFAEECSALQHLVEQRIPLEGAGDMTTLRHHCLFLPKFHCELNWIERMWGASKQYVRKHCLYTLPGLRETVPISLSQDLADVPAHLATCEECPVSPLFKQRRWCRVSRRFMAEYRKGKDACSAILAVKQQISKRHRDTSDARSRQVEAAMAAQAVSH